MLEVSHVSKKYRGCQQALEDVSLSVRYGDDGVRYAFLINNSESDKRLCLDELNGGVELLTGHVVDGPVELKPYGVNVIELG